MASKPTTNARPELTARYICDTYMKSDDQKIAFAQALDPSFKYHLFYGGAGSGKSWLIMLIVILRALGARNSRHAVFRLTRNSCEQTLFLKTFFEVMQQVFPDMLARLTAEGRIGYSAMTVEFPNGSQLFFNGLDENRLTKVLGDEFNTVWLNECNEDGLTYKTISVLTNRLRAKREIAENLNLKNKMFFDCNPRFYSDWEYKAFKLNVNPDDGDAMPRPQQWRAQKLRTELNLDNLGDDYMEGMETMSASARRRYLAGEWSDENTNALFTEAMFKSNRIPLPREYNTPELIRSYLYEERGINLVRTTVAVDPAKKHDIKADLNGITVQALADDGHVYVLADYSQNASPVTICETIRDAYHDWGASRIVVESNAAGTWIDTTMQLVWPNAPALKNIAATKQTGNKTDRAEPVAAQYERNIIHHVGTHKDLEAQMCDWGSPASLRKSPDRMDAVVWGITELLDLAREKKAIPGMRLGRGSGRRS